MASYANIAAGSLPDDNFVFVPEETYSPVCVNKRKRPKSYDIEARFEDDCQSLGWIDIIHGILKLGIKRDEIRCLQTLAKGHFTVSLRTEEATLKLINFVVKDITCEVTKTPDFEEIKYVKNRKVTIFNLPFELPDAVLLEKMITYGRVLQVKRLCLKGFPGIENGVREVLMDRHAKPVPKFIFVKGNKFRAIYDGQETQLKNAKKCHVCGELGHLQAECPNRDKQPIPTEIKEAPVLELESQSVLAGSGTCSPPKGVQELEASLDTVENVGQMKTPTAQKDLNDSSDNLSPMSGVCRLPNESFDFDDGDIDLIERAIGAEAVIEAIEKKRKREEALSDEKHKPANKSRATDMVLK